ncbi:winged helix DNA-binding protein [Thiotrichales bacterium 19S3-7]|nr:winged helix DNA-binding protein [Thiotrichales bacterium 19S3-7]MCF6800565.1 winged helix DNA-binding protein [Thiotrichales bacterium 19S3-11]
MDISKFSALTILFRDMASIWRKYFNQFAHEHDLTPLDRMLLVTLVFEGDRSSKSDLASALKLESQSLTRSLKRLEQNGYILREQSHEDGRSVLHSLTEKGQMLVLALGKEADQFWTLLLKGCPEKDIEAFKRVMKHCISQEQKHLLTSAI